MPEMRWRMDAGTWRVCDGLCRPEGAARTHALGPCCQSMRFAAPCSADAGLCSLRQLGYQPDPGILLDAEQLVCMLPDAAHTGSLP